jgi:AraC-like DNA-binding protein
MIFERHHSTLQNPFRIIIEKENRGFPLHIHKAYECYTVITGEARVTVGKKVYTLLPGESVLVFPYESHSYETKENTSTWEAIFSPELVSSFHNPKALPKSNKFKLGMEIPKSCDGILFQKAIAYNICAVFDSTAEYEYGERREENLALRLLTYISENFRKNITLSDLANSVGYDYSYVSKVFKRATRLSFKDYVSDLRIGEAAKLLNTTDLSIQAISEACGFSCTRTFHREFSKIMKTTPRDYRESFISRRCSSMGRGRYSASVGKR